MNSSYVSFFGKSYYEMLMEINESSKKTLTIKYKLFWI